MASVGTLTVDLIAQTASFNSNIEKAARNLNSNASRMNRSLDSVKRNISGMRAEAEGLALGLAIAGAARFIKSNLDLAGALGETAQQVGVTTRELQVFRAIGGQAGVASDEMDKAIAKLTVSLGKASVGAKANNEAFQALGISITDASGKTKSTGDVLGEIADKLSKISDPAQRAAAEVAIFGRAGQKLDTILTGGRAGIEAYAKQAEDMGLILSDDLVNAADAASDKVEQLNAQLTANIAGAVAQNAGAILGLANALTQLTTGALNFISTYPRLAAALAGAAVGSRFGLPGAVIGAGVGTIGGDVMARSNANSNMDLKFRTQKLNAALAQQSRLLNGSKGGGSLFSLRTVGADEANGVTLQGATAEVRRQTALLQAATVAKRASNLPPVASVDLPDFLAPGGGGGGRKSGGRSRVDNSAERAREKALRDAEAFASDLARLDQDLLSAKRDNLSDIQMIAQADRQQLDAETESLKRSIEADVALEKYTRAQADQLLTKVDQVKAERLITIRNDEIAELLDKDVRILEAANDNARDILQAQESLATTSAERRQFALQLLALDEQEERLKQQQIINLAKIGKATAEEARAAQDRIDAMPAVYGARKEAATRETAGPLERYLADINDVGKINEAIEQIEVDGIQALSDGLSQVIMGTKSLGDAFRDVANQIVADLLRIAIQKLIVKAIGSVGIPGFAAGTNNAPSGLALVGERGPEIVRFKGGEQVIPNHRLRGSAGNDNPVNITLNMQASGNPRADRESADQAARALQARMASARRIGAF